MKLWLKRLLAVLGISLLFMPAESDSGGSDSDSGGSDSDSGDSDSGDALASSASGSDSAQLLGSIISGDPTGRQVGNSDESSSNRSASSDGDDNAAAKKRKRPAPRSTEGMSAADLSQIPYSDQYADFDTPDSSDDGGGSDSLE